MIIMMRLVQAWLQPSLFRPAPRAGGEVMQSVDPILWCPGRHGEAVFPVYKNASPPA